MRPGHAICGLLLSMMLLALGSGCAGWRSARHDGKLADNLYAVSSESAPFYSRSPRQGCGPDKTIPKGTPMNLIRSSFAFCKVQLLTGEKGYVPNDNIAVAPHSLVASLDPASQAVASSASWRAEIPQPRSNAPEPPLPEFEPTPIPDLLNPGN